MPSINFKTNGFTTIYQAIRGNRFYIDIYNIPTKSGNPYRWAWNLRAFTTPDPKTGTISQSDSGTLPTSTTTKKSLYFDLPSTDYTLGSKHTFGFQLQDDVSGEVLEELQVVIAITADSVDDAGQQIINNANPSNFVRSVLLTGLSLVTGGAISATDTTLQAFGKLQNQMNSKANTSSLAIVATSGSYSDLSGTPTIPDISTKVAKSGDTMTGKLTVRNEIEINNSSIVGDNNGVIQKIDNVGGKGVFRWLFNNASSFPVIASFFRAVDNTLDYVEFSGRVTATNLSGTNTGDAKPPSVIFPYHGNGSAAATSQAVTANSCKAALFEILAPTTVDAIQYTVGATSSGNVRAGIYQIATANKNNNSNIFTGSTLVADSGSVAQGAASNIQTLTFTPVTLQPGKYFMALMLDNATGTFMRHTNAATGIGWVHGYTAGSFAFTTPAPAPTDTTSNNVPNYKLRVVTNY